MSTDMLKCDVCGQPAIGVASSSFGAISFAFCETCVRKPAEPFIMFEYLYDEVSTNGEGLINLDYYYTFKDGKYITWPEYVQWRHSVGRAKSEPCEPPPYEPYDGEDDDNDIGVVLPAPEEQASNFGCD